MCLQVIVELFVNAIGIMLGAFILFVILFYLVGFLIGAFMGAVLLIFLVMKNPLTWIFLIALILGGCILLNR